jgi:hypothetical protein
MRHYAAVLSDCRRSTSISDSLYSSHHLIAIIAIIAARQLFCAAGQKETQMRGALVGWRRGGG